VYWENCVLISRGRAIPAGEAVILESVQLAYDREWPVPQLIAFGAVGDVYNIAGDTGASALSIADSPASLAGSDILLNNPSVLPGQF